LSNEQKEALTRCGSLQEAVLLLKNTRYQVFYDAYTKTGEITLGELAIMQSKIDLFLSIRSGFFGAERNFVNALLLEMEIHNLKTVLGAWFSSIMLKHNKPQHELFLRQNMIHTIDIDAILKSSSYQGIVDALSNTPYAAVLQPYIAKAETSGSLFYLTVALDIYRYQRIKRAVINLPNSVAQKVRISLAVERDFANLTAQLWYKRANMPESEAAEFLLPDGLHLNRQHIFEVIQSSQNVQQFLQESYPLENVPPSVSNDVIELVEYYHHIHTTKRVLALAADNPLTVSPVLSYLSTTLIEERLVINLLEGVNLHVGEQRLREVLCLQPRL
jgi:vacuolar-type H+-ATPase subunit C/Vma6